MEQREIPAKGSPCPRCGEPIDWLKVHRIRYGNRVYEYLTAVHYLGYEGGRKRIRRCHLGPLEHYLHVEKTMGVEVRGQGVGEERVKRLLESIKSLVLEARRACSEMNEELGYEMTVECRTVRKLYLELELWLEGEGESLGAVSDGEEEL